MTKRPYDMRRRAVAQDRTRQRIVEATIALHQAKGVAATSVADIADLAGVGKVTVYRHFPDDAALFAACSGTYMERHPMPDVEAWRRTADPHGRLRRGLRETYRYHRETELMMARVLPEVRDDPLMAPVRAHWQRAVEILAEPWGETGRERAMLHAALALALAFDSWHLLVRRQGLTDAQAIALMTRMIETRGAGAERRGAAEGG